MLTSANNTVQSVEGYGEYRAAQIYLSTDMAVLGLPDLKEEEAPTFDKEGKKHKLIWQYPSPVRAGSDAGSNFASFESYISDFSYDPSKSPFDVLDETSPGKEKIRQFKKISQIINSLVDGTNIEFAQKLADRLLSLYDAVREDPEEDLVPLGSLRNFVKFLRSTPRLKYPDVVLTPSNEVSAQWRKAPNRHFAVVFQATGEARFVIFTPNPKDAVKTDRLSGITSVEALMDVAKPHGVFDWAAQ
jgi:hypothetical protein